MFDFIVVGFGVAGMAVTSHLEAKGKTVLVVDGNYVKASVVAAGVYNPVVLKRFTMAWNADEQLEYAKQFYGNLEENLSDQFLQELPVLRRFNSVEEQNNWFSKLSNPTCNKYMSDQLVSSVSEVIPTPHKCGEVKGTGRVLIKKMEDSYRRFLVHKDSYLNEDFDYSKLKLTNEVVSYKGQKSKGIIFCEGYNLNKNPFFNELPLIGSRGCYLIFECENLQLKAIFKSHFFLVPLGNDKYKFGATYEHQFKNMDHDSSAKNLLINELEKLISEPYSVVSFQIGVRPTVIDRRPLIGRHKEHKNMYVCNGMGTRGVMLAPTSANHLVNFITNDTPIPSEMNITRFEE